MKGSLPRKEVINHMTKKKKITVVVSLLLAIVLLVVIFIPKNKKQSASAEKGTVIAFTDGELSESFLTTTNPIYATSDLEYALGTLIAPTVMRYDSEKGWQPVLGTITTEVKDGKTVATVTLNNNIRYSNKQKISISAYVKVLERITRISSTAYYKDFYKNPIEGLVAFRYNSKGITLKDIPDFEAELDKIFKDLSKNDYQKLLEETNVAGIYTDAQNPESIAPEGCSFKQLVLDKSKNEEVKESGFFVSSDIGGKMVKILSEIYASFPEEQWMLEELRTAKNQQLQSDFIKQLNENTPSCPTIPGVWANSAGTNNYCQVTFTEIIDEDEAIRILNLPVIYTYTLNDSTRVIGAGSYTYAGVSKGRQGAMARLSSDKKLLSVITLDANRVLDSMNMGQIDVAALSLNLTKEEKQIYEKNGYQWVNLGNYTVVYNARTVNAEFLEEIAMIFSS